MRSIHLLSTGVTWCYHVTPPLHLVSPPFSLSITRLENNLKRKLRTETNFVIEARLEHQTQNGHFCCFSMVCFAAKALNASRIGCCHGRCPRFLGRGLRSWRFFGAGEQPLPAAAPSTAGGRNARNGGGAAWRLLEEQIWAG